MRHPRQCAMRRALPCRGLRPGAAALELALLLPLLVLLLVIGFDFGRVFYYSQTIMNCARNGAIYGCDPKSTTQSPYASLTEAALADANNLNPPPSVTATNGTDKTGNAYVEVAVSWPFQSATGFPGIPKTITLQRKVRMRMIPAY